MSSNSRTSLEYRIASKVHARFDALPPNCKPRVHPNGTREWIPLSAVVLVTNQGTDQEELTVVSIATGAKCLPTSQVDKCKGLVLHDSHAEILALRGFNYWLLNECKVALSEKIIPGGEGPPTPTASPFLEYRNPMQELADEMDLPPFHLHPNINIYMYGTCAPCGDASMELIMAAQEDATPWSRTEHQSESSERVTSLLDGRGYFSHLGVVRRKPSRADAEPTLSKSCSDKLALKQVTSILSTFGSALVAPTKNAFIKGLILPEDEVSDVACARAFGDGETGRMRVLKNSSWSSGSTRYAFKPFDIIKLPSEQVESLWRFEKPKDRSSKARIGNVSVSWICGSSADNGQKHTKEVIINGVKQGSHISSPSPKKGSVLCRAKMWDLLRDVSYALHAQSKIGSIMLGLNGSYSDLKNEIYSIPSCAARREALTAGRSTLGNWVTNDGDGSWNLVVLDEVAGIQKIIT